MLDMHISCRNEIQLISALWTKQKRFPKSPNVSNRVWMKIESIPRRSRLHASDRDRAFTQRSLKSWTSDESLMLMVAVNSVNIQWVNTYIFNVSSLRCLDNI